MAFGKRTSDFEHGNGQQQQQFMHGVVHHGDAAPPRNVAHHVERSSLFLRFCKLMNYGAGIASLITLLAHLSVISSVDRDVTESVMRCYGVLFGILGMLVETEWTKFFVYFLILENWTGRGLFYIFSGVFVQRNLSNGTAVSQEEKSVNHMCAIAGTMMLVCGIVYFCLGLLCFRYLKERQLNRIRQRQQMEEEMSDLELRKQEIERLLAETETKLNTL